MKKLVSFFIFILFSTYSFGQQDPEFSHNMFDHLSVNPAAAGLYDAVNARLLNSQKMLGMPNAPVTTTFAVDAPLTFIGIENTLINNSGVGLFFATDEAGFRKNFDFKFDYSYRLKDIGFEESVLQIGLGLGIRNGSFASDTDWLIPSGKAASTDISFPAAGASASVFDLDLGVFYKIGTGEDDGNWYTAFSLKHLSSPTVDFNGVEENIKRHYYLTGGYVYETPNPLFQVRPSIFILSDGISSKININANVWYDRKYWGGVSYGIGESIGLMIGGSYEDFEFGYSYNMARDGISEYSSGSHEIMVGYRFNISMEPKGRTKHDKVRG